MISGASSILKPLNVNSLTSFTKLLSGSLSESRLGESTIVDGYLVPKFATLHISFVLLVKHFGSFCCLSKNQCWILSAAYIDLTREKNVPD